MKTTANVLCSLTMAALMSLVLSGVMTVVITDPETGLIAQWMRAYLIAFPTAIVAQSLVRPLATLITRKLVGT